MYSSSAVVNGRVYFGADDTVYALDAASGKKMWNYTTGGVGESSPAVANSVVYIGSNDHNVYAFDAATGNKVWNYTTGNEVNGSPTVANGVIYLGSKDNKVYAFGSIAAP
jgi:outer membrane protein assembly factor BamB